MDKFDALTRSKLMGRIGPRNTRPEMTCRAILTDLGLRYRLHGKHLPGTPDIYITRLRTAIYVNGCFWHQHKGCQRSRRPSSNVEFWNAKLDANIARDRKNLRILKRMGWSPIVIWECQTRSVLKVTQVLMKRLGMNK